MSARESKYHYDISIVDHIITVEVDEFLLYNSDVYQLRFLDRDEEYNRAWAIVVFIVAYHFIYRAFLHPS